MWDFSSLTRDQTRTPYIGKWSRNPWTARAVPGLLPWLPSPHFTCRFLPSELLFILQNPFSRSLWWGLVLWGWPEHHMPWGSAAPPRTHMQKGAVSSSLLSSQLARSWVASAGARLILNVWCQSGAWHIVASQKASCKWPDRGLGGQSRRPPAIRGICWTIRRPRPCCQSFTLAGSTFAPADEAYLSYFLVPTQLFHFSAPSTISYSLRDKPSIHSSTWQNPDTL